MKNSFYLFGILTMCLLFGCSNAIDEPVAQSHNGSVLEKVTESDLIRNLHAYNDSLYMANSLTRLYNPLTNELVGQQTRTSNNWKIYYKDAKGAFRGARFGFRYGMGFSPSGAIAGAAVGAILNGALRSAFEYWKQNNMIVVNPNGVTELVASEAIFQPETLYEMALAIETDVAIARPLGVELEMGSNIEAIGLAHNLLLDRMMGGENSVNGSGPTDDNPGDLQPEQPVVILSYIDELFEDEFTAEMIASEIFQQDFEELVEQELEESMEDSMVTPSDDIPELILNLCYEAVTIYENSACDAAAVINFYYEEVENSDELTEEEKTAIYAGLSVMIYSSSYWTERGEIN